MVPPTDSGGYQSQRRVEDRIVAEYPAAEKSELYLTNLTSAASSSSAPA